MEMNNTLREFTIAFEYHDNIWIAQCEALRITLEGHFFDTLVARMKMAIQEIAEVELGYHGDIRLVITVQDRIDDIKAVS